MHHFLMKGRNLIILSSLIFLIGINGSIFSHNAAKKDSLLHLINSTNDKSTKLGLYYKLVGPKVNRIDEEGKLFLDIALELATELDSNYHKALFNIYIGEFFIQKGNYTESFNKLQTAIIIGKNIESQSILTRAYFDVASIYFYRENYSKSEEYSLIALESANKEKASIYYGSIYSLLGATYGEKKEHEEAKNYMNQYLNYGIETNDSSYILSAYSSLALLHGQMKQIDSSMHYSRLALKMAESNNDLQNQLKICNSLTRIYTSIGELDSAHYYLTKALSLKENSNSTRKVYLTYLYAYQFYKKAEVSDSALYYYEAFVNIKDSIYGADQFDEISLLEAKLEDEKKQKEIESLKNKNRINNILMYSFLLILVLIILIGIISIRSIRMKNNLMKQNHTLLEQKSIALNEKVSFQQQEIINNAGYIITQNKIYDRIIDELKALSKFVSDENSVAFNAIIHKIQKNKKGTQQKEFEVKFMESHQEFYRKIEEIYPQLAKKELDLCAFLNLNMSSKEIAAITSQSTRALEVARSRLRKKLGIDRHINLAEFIRAIGHK